MHFDVRSRDTGSSVSRTARFTRIASTSAPTDQHSGPSKDLDPTTTAPDPLDLTSPVQTITDPKPAEVPIALSEDFGNHHHSPNWHPPETFVERVQDRMYENSAVINTFIAGGLAGATSRTVVSPLERLKIILQVQAPSTSKTAAGQAYGKVWPGLMRMWKEEGFAGFMKGNGINVIRILPYSAIQFSSYSYTKTLLARWSGQETLSTPLRLLSGATAGILAVSATYPLDLVRARLSIATANITRTSNALFTAEDAALGIVGMTKKVYRTEGGIKGLYRGCWATAVGVAPYVSLNFYIYETLKPIILPPDYHPTHDIELVARKLLSGALAGGTSLLFTHPFDVVRRKLQVVGIGGSEREFSGAIDCIRKISAREGFWKGMYRGLVPNIIKVVPSIAVSFYTFETVKESLTDWSNRDKEECA